ncbi:ATP-binding cassette domain-containing protein [Limosilactobacillus mucosae]|uniref:ABC transporter ATP-binding protein n=1 Tax=Limosilactobacillus mucosae TaxID=97478 RepID=UPI00233ECD01|nr:ATP-binding cassette domain-containing protein [Limosilactobacillus mucosae]MDC2838543.1 ATP-binding cassette domain-containing protein [Limosilactobacillus mucosae]MDC2844299.1 ATP-binding cassette domain-containing protein [Limosilactobacillus mucosae]
MLNVNNINIYYGRKHIIKDASFQINPGEIVGLIGPNGAGKTTIMKTLLGLTKFTGSVTFNGQEVTASNHKALQQVGALIENPAIYPFLTGMENLKLYSNSDKDLQKLILRMGMDSYINEPAKSYSIGMKQKLGIALALLNNPKLVILDEPMNGLDIEATILIRKLIHDYAANGTAFLISSHVLSELQKVMTYVIILNHKEIVMNAPIDEFKKTKVTHYQLITDSNQQADNLLTDNNVKLTTKNNAFIVQAQDINYIQKLLYQNNISLIELTPIRKTFEQSIVDILREKWGRED